MNEANALSENVKANATFAPYNSAIVNIIVSVSVVYCRISSK